MMRSARMAGVVLLLVWIGPVTFVQTDAWLPLRLIDAPDCAAAGSKVIPAGEAVKLEAGTPLKLHLHDGSVLEGRYLGRTLLDSAMYTPRFAKSGRAASLVPFALGETLQVKLRDGRAWTEPFVGYAQLALLLRNPDGPQPLRVPFEFASEIRRAGGESVEPEGLAKAFREGLLPSAEALVLEPGLPMGTASERLALRLPLAIQDIASVTAEMPGRSAAGVVVLGVAVVVILLVVSFAALGSSASSGCSGTVPNLQAAAGGQLTSRPFDRYRGCYVGDPLATADPSPDSTGAGSAGTPAEPSPSAIPTE